MRRSFAQRLPWLLVGLAGQYVGLYRVEDEVRTLGHMLLVVFALYAPIKVENMILGGGILKSGERPLFTFSGTIKRVKRRVPASEVADSH